MSAERIAPVQHDSLDGIPEPGENPALVGHGEAAAELAAAHRAGKLPHALVFAGPQGIGKATLAFRLAYHLLRHPRGEAAPDRLETPDPASSLFRQIATEAHPSLLHLTRPRDDRNKDRFKTVLSVAEVRRVGHFLSLRSHDGGYRVVIVDPADDLNRSAANALLKNLEEPPALTLFVLIAHSPGALLPTIRSRCQVVRLSPLSPAELAAALKAIGRDAAGSPGDIAALADRSGGSVRTALLLSDYGGLEIAATTDRLVRQPQFDVGDAHRLADAVSGRDQAIQFGIFNEHALDLVAQAAQQSARGSDLGRAKMLADTWHDAAQAISDAEAYNLDRKLHVLTMIRRLNAAMRM